jgi:gluconokinase
MKRMIVIMSVAGCGKTTVGERLADATGFAFVDGDRLHPRANIEKMSMGQPLIDEDRWPWLAAVGKTLAQSDRSIIIVYSALCAVIHRMLMAAGLGSEDQAALMEFFKGPDKEQFR